MLSEHLTQQLLALPLSERVALAQILWQSIDEEPDSDVIAEEHEAVAQAKRRSEELASGVVVGRSHDEVMEAAQRVLECG